MQQILRIGDFGWKITDESVRNAQFEFGNPNPQIHEDRNEEVEKVERFRGTRLIIFGLIGFIRFLVKSPVII